ncbi:mitochondrial outer membrane import complex protein METAXIN-like isoform X2 [Gastrolobium bilobum]|uniref:mitochondrial outer membrane import complex protein METAXIN-like isoform X2 n=1 Tax=Gastrolobium bilobum TaxID=150636 RepID=UPI002AAF2377|nr:mitochondrial outer membrane import complex protein METAXIN-like isoform X2 [Gastrolobium bilobum]
METEGNESTRRKTLVVRKPCFGLPTDQIPYFENGDYVAYNNEKEGIIECLKRDVGDLDSEVCSLPGWMPTKVMLTTWLADALEYELWVGCDASSAYNIYYSDLPWPIGKVLFWKKVHWVKQKHGITKDNGEVKEEEIYGRAKSAYDALSIWLGEGNYLFENRPSSLDAIFLAHALVVLQALPESSMLRINLLEHAILVRYVQQCKTELIEAGSFSSSDPYFHADASSSASRGRSTSSSKPKSKPKREKTKEEKTFRRRAKYFVVSQLVAVALFLSITSGFGNNGDVEIDDGFTGYGYDD